MILEESEHEEWAVARWVIPKNGSPEWLWLSGARFYKEEAPSALEEWIEDFPGAHAQSPYFLVKITTKIVVEKVEE